MVFYLWILILGMSFYLPRMEWCRILLLGHCLDSICLNLLYFLAILVLRKAIERLKTMCLVRLCLFPILPLVVDLFQRIFHHLYTRLVFHDPTIVVLICTNRKLFPSSDSLFFHIFLVWSLLLFVCFFDFLILYLRVVSFLQTIALIDRVQPLRLFFLSILHYGLFLRLRLKDFGLLNLLLIVFCIQICLVLRIAKHFYSLFHLDLWLRFFLDYDVVQQQSR